MSANFGKNKKLIMAAKAIARLLRRHQTVSEGMFWQAVRNNNFLGLKFYRQHPLFFEYVGHETFFVTDFYCHEKLLAIEIDGPIHKFQKEYDQLREYIINAMGIRVLRFTNDEVEKNLNGVLKIIEEFITCSDDELLSSKTKD